MLDFLFAPLLVPLALWSALSLWWLIVVGFLALLTQGLVYVDNRESSGDGDFVRAVLALVVLFAVISWATTDVNGFWLTVWVVLKKLAIAFLQYGIYGVMAAFPLWMLHYRKYYEVLNEGVRNFMEEVIDEHGAVRGISDEQRELALDLARRYQPGKDVPGELVAAWSEYRNREYDLRRANEKIQPKENKWLIATFILLWPFHVVDAVFGELLYRLGRWIVTQVARLLNRLAGVMKFGMPKNLDA